MQFKTEAALIEFVLNAEERASNLYRDAVKFAPDRKSREFLEEMAMEELDHRDFFAGLDLKSDALIFSESHQDYNFSESFEAMPYYDGISYVELLIYAIKQEESFSRFYQKLAEQAQGDMAVILSNLAETERQHKIRLEELFRLKVDSDL